MAGMMVVRVSRGRRGRPKFRLERAPDGLRKRVSFVVWRLALLLNRESSKKLATLGLTPHHYAILCCLEQRGSCCQRDVTRQTGIHGTNLIAPIDALLDRELISREVDDDDRRRDDIRLQGSGERLLRRAEQLLDEVEDRLLHTLLPQERVALRDLAARAMSASAGAR
jgi:MarR family transcriptional regulator, lower aerobic nicotinate degradation pathway regulator